MKDANKCSDGHDVNVTDFFDICAVKILTDIIR